MQPMHAKTPLACQMDEGLAHELDTLHEEAIKTLEGCAAEGRPPLTERLSQLLQARGGA